MKITIEVTEEELNWLKKYFEVRSTIFGGTSRHRVMSMANKILARILITSTKQGDNNEPK